MQASHWRYPTAFGILSLTVNGMEYECLLRRFPECRDFPSVCRSVDLKLVVGWKCCGPQC
jgi:hypothetical protein